MYPLKQSTALDVLFFAHDANGDPITGKVNGDWSAKKLSKNGAAFAAITNTVTEREGGWYHIQLSTTDTDTLGILTLFLTAAGVKQVNLQYRVTARIHDDLAYPATSGRSIDVDATGGVEITPNQAVNVAQYLGGAAPALVGGRFDASVGAMAANVLTSSALDATATDEVANQVWDELRADHVIVGSFGQGAASVQGNVTGSVGSVGGGGITAGSFANNAIDSSALAANAAQEIADEILNRDLALGTDSGSPTVRTVRQAIRMNRNRVNVSGGTITVYKEDDVTPSWTGVVTTTAGNPVTQIDPA